MRLKLKIIENKKNNQLNLSLPRKAIDGMLKANGGKRPKWVNVNLKDIEW